MCGDVCLLFVLLVVGRCWTLLVLFVLFLFVVVGCYFLCSFLCCSCLCC